MVRFTCLSVWIELCVYSHVFSFYLFWWFVFVVVFTHAQGPTQTPLCYLQPWVEAGMVDAIGAPPGAGVWYSPVQLLLKVGTVLRYGVSHQPHLHIQCHYFSDPLFTVLLHAPVKCWLSIPSIIPPFITPMQLLVISLIACPYRTIILHLLYHASIYLISFLLSNQSESRCVHSTMTYKLWILSHYFSL